MAILLKKLKSQSQASAAPAAKAPTTSEDLSIIVSDFASIIDKVGLLQAEAEPIVKQIKELTDRLKPLKAAEKELQDKLDALAEDADATGMEYGANFVVQYKAKGTSRSITDLQKVREFLGDDTFFQLASITLKDADAYLTPPQKEQCITETRSKRGYTLSKRAA